MIPDDVVEEVRDRADLVEVVGEVVKLKRSGKDWKGKCPFHDDRTPSFYVVPSKGFYTCFGCGASGDVFNFVMERQGLDFLEAVKQVGARFGVEVRDVGPGSDEAEDPFRAHHEANGFARQFFRDALADPQVGAEARRYLEGRGIDEEARERFGLGFAPDDWRALRTAAVGHGMSEDLLLEVGLLTTSERASEPYDRFRNRIIFPIESVAGKVVAFGGRVLSGAGPKVPKYLNSPETPVYHKGDVLYALHWNRHAIRRASEALVVEGYMDVVALSAGGVEHSVATLGTAMTPEHARLLGRYTRKALLLFDSDEAGLRATFRAADVLLAEGIHPAVVTLPPGEDPDTVVRSEGAEGLRGYLDGAVDVVDRKIQLLEEKGFLDSIERKRTAVDKLLPTLRAAADPTLRDLYVDRVAAATGVRRRTLESELERDVGRPTGHRSADPGAARHGQGGHRGSSSGRPVPSGQAIRGNRRRPTRSLSEVLGPERKLLLVLLGARDWLDRALEKVGPEEFQDPHYRAIFQALVEDPGLDAPPADMPAETARRLEDLLGDPEDLEATDQLFEGAVGQLVARSFDARHHELRAELERAESDEERRRIVEALQHLRRERPGRWGVARRDPTGAPPNDSIRKDG